MITFLTMKTTTKDFAGYSPGWHCQWEKKTGPPEYGGRCKKQCTFCKNMKVKEQFGPKEK